MARYRLEVGPVPLHHQVYVDLKAALDSGEHAVGERLPPERELARLYGCSLITIRRALDELSREGRLGRQQGRGTFVLPPRLDRDIAGSMSSGVYVLPPPMTVSFRPMRSSAIWGGTSRSRVVPRKSLTPLPGIAYNVINSREPGTSSKFGW